MPDDAPSIRRRENQCPRCGYDQTGVTSRWTETCDLVTTCSECGLRIDWGDILSDKRRRPRWCVEYARRWWHVPGRSVTTLAMMCWPWGFWKSLKMHHEVRWGRIVMVSVVVLFAAYFAIGSVTAIRSWKWWRELDADIQTSVALASQANSQNPGLTARPSPWKVVGWAFVMPFSPKSAGKWDYSLALSNGTLLPRSTPMYEPARFQDYDNRLWFTSSYKDFFPHQLHWIAAHPIIIAVLVPLTFVLLPRTRKVCSIRRAHLIRIVLYHSFILMVYLLWLLQWGFDRVNSQWQWQTVGERLGVAVAIVMPAATIMWWGTACSRYLKLPHAWGVAAAAYVIPCLLLLICGYFWIFVEQWIDAWLWLVGGS